MRGRGIGRRAVGRCGAGLVLVLALLLFAADHDVVPTGASPADLRCRELAAQVIGFGGSLDPARVRFLGGTERADGGEVGITIGKDTVFCGFGGDDRVRRNSGWFLGGDGHDSVVDRNRGRVWGGPGDDYVSTQQGVFLGGEGDDGVGFEGGRFDGGPGDDWVGEADGPCGPTIERCGIF